jgi:flagellar hook-associated protein 1 FlgK
LQAIYGDPSSSASLESVFSSFTSAVQSLVTSPDSTATRSLVLANAQVLAQTLNTTTADIQTLRTNAEGGLADAVATANDAMQQIADLNARLAGKDITSSSDAALADQRDSYVDRLSKLMDIRVVTNNLNQISVFTNSGVELVGAKASQLAFNAQGTVNATTLWDADPTKSNLGTLTLTSPGGTVDRLDCQQLDPVRSDCRLARHAGQRAGSGAKTRSTGSPPQWRRRCRT